MASPMLKHTLTADWVKIADNVNSFVLQGMGGGYRIHLGDTAPDGNSGAVTAPREDGQISMSNLGGGNDLYVQAASITSVGAVINGMAS